MKLLNNNNNAEAQKALSKQSLNETLLNFSH